ncbi:MAG: hypothetical protein U1F16_04485 [Turneriella sp.]
MQRSANTKYALGSVLNHVLLHQTIIGEEALKQMAIAGEFPDVSLSVRMAAAAILPVLLFRLFAKKSR